LSEPIEFRAADFSHPIFDPLRPALEQLGGRDDWPSLERLNSLAERAAVRTASRHEIRFVAPSAGTSGYEPLIHATGRVPTRTRNWHDLFNALVWLAFPRSKAALNALHVAEMPREGGRRGPVRDLLTLLDEGGVLVAYEDDVLPGLVGDFRWKELFWTRRASAANGMRLAVLGHAVLEMALRPWPGVTCKALFLRVPAELLAASTVELTRELDQRAADWLLTYAAQRTPRDVPPLPVFGYPGWHPGNERGEFYDDTRYFRPFRRALAGAADASRIG
jgi:hypothetical protein